MTAFRIQTALILLGLSSMACGGPAGPRIRVASATAADLQAVHGEDTIWYEFRKGDVVPFQFIMIGASQSAADPVEIRAVQDFWIVMSKDAPMQFSFDGETLVQQQVELLSLVMPGDDGKAKLVWINYFGEGDAAQELDRIVKAAAEGPKSESAAPESPSPEAPAEEPISPAEPESPAEAESVPAD